MKFCQVKKIVRNLEEEKKYKTEKISKEKEIIF